MLALTRKRDESIRIETSDGTITVRIVKVHGRNVRVAVGAPKQCVILRSELAKAELPAPIAQPKKRRKTNTTRAA